MTNNGAKFTFKPSPRSFTSNAPKCPLCKKSVYAAEQVLGPNSTPYHKMCLKCTSCSKVLDPINLLEHGYNPYCKICHSRAFGTRGVGFGNAVVDSTPKTNNTRTNPSSPSIQAPIESNLSNHPLSTGIGSYNGSPSSIVQKSTPPSYKSYCSPTGKSQLQMPERKKFNLQESTTTRLRGDPRIQEIEGEEEDSEFEPPLLNTLQITVKARPMLTPDKVNRDYSTPDLGEQSNDSFSIAPSINSVKEEEEEGDRSNVSVKSLGQSPLPVMKPMKNIKEASFSKELSLSVENGNEQVVESPSKVSDSIYRGYKSSNSPRKINVLSQFGNDGPKLCPRCSSTVYHAEQILALGKKWHKRCLRCQECNKTLETNSMNEREGKPYCFKCYDAKFGMVSQGLVVVEFFFLLLIIVKSLLIN
ncbi:expressed protein [Phakopsora pachyrhizi]|uniref:Expressed protein n=1 Tax=Phakopsora pachyrhizi TaxID=170000 RepID=A0AAV0B6I0_PHAPC|nr:expressed protein [Phakopsora pachyrhizi]